MSCDLHMHSTCSDGSLGVRELVRAVHAAGVRVFALTDHDTVEGLPEARSEAKVLGLTLINGIEISTRLDDIELHILGYGFDPEHAALGARLMEQKRARHARIPNLVRRLNELGVSLSVEQVYAEAGKANPGRPHVAKAMVRAGYVRDYEEAFERYLGDYAQANIRKPAPAPEQAISWIHAAGGKAVWAHPLARSIQRTGGFDTLVRDLEAYGLDGIEEVHPSQNAHARRRIRRMARKLSLRLTGGSDFHGEASPGVRLGVGRGNDVIPSSVATELLA